VAPPRGLVLSHPQDLMCASRHTAVDDFLLEDQVVRGLAVRSNSLETLLPAGGCPVPLGIKSDQVGSLVGAGHTPRHGRLDLGGLSPALPGVRFAESPIR